MENSDYNERCTMKVLFWSIILILVFLIPYLHAADPILIRTDCFDASLTYGINSLGNEYYLHWVKITGLRIKEAIVKLKFSVQDADGSEESGLVTPNDTFNGHTVYFSERYVKFSVGILHNGETQFVTEYINFKE